RPRLGRNRIHRVPPRVPGTRPPLKIISHKGTRATKVSSYIPRAPGVLPVRTSPGTTRSSRVYSPRMPDDLSPTEQRIIEGLRAGLKDAEIAVRLGLTVGDTKERITRLLQRHRLLDRQALLDWAAGDRAAAAPGMRAEREAP